MTPSSSPVPHRHRPRQLLSLVVGVALVVLLVGCVPTGERPRLTDEALDDLPVADGAIPCAAPSDPFAAFGSTVVRVVRPDGPLGRCVLVADTPELRARGLMEVEHLAGYEGMVFAFPDDSVSGFWMGNTVIPLSIAFVDATGAVVAVFDMEPCPESVGCPTYEPHTPYRWAIEVPLGGLDAFGLGPGALLDLSSLPGAVA